MRRAILAGLLATACASNGSATSAAVDSDAWMAVDGAGSASRGPHDVVGRLSDGPKATAGVLPDGKAGESLGLVLNGPLNNWTFRSQVAAGKVPSASDFSMAGWLNENDSPLPPANPARPVDMHALAAVVAETPEKSEVILQLGFNTAGTLADLQPAVDLVIGIDRSASLGQDAVKAIAAGILDAADSLPANSSLTLVVFDAGAAEIFQAVPYAAKNRPALANELRSLQSGGATDLYGGLQFCIGELAKLTKKAPQQRILLVTDGAATAGEHGNADFVDLGKKAGVPVSAIGVGAWANGAMLAKLAAVAGGSYFEAPTLAALQQAFAKDLASVLVPVAQELAVAIELAPGWGLLDGFGLPLVQNGQTLQIAAASKPSTADAAAVDTVAPVDVAASDATSLPPTTVAAAVLFPSQRNGLLAVRLQLPGGTAITQALALTLAKTSWSYKLTKTGEKNSHTGSVEVSGLLAIPDGGYEYYSAPVAKRTSALIRLGEAMQGACGLFQKGGSGAAQELIKFAVNYAERMKTEYEPAATAGDTALADAIDLANTLAGNMAAKLGK